MIVKQTEAIATELEPRRMAPSGWASHTIERTWTIRRSRSAVWAWLNDPRTFTRQPWPYRVEFVEGSGVNGGSAFEPGVLNVHHGPLLHACGVITLVDDGPDGAGRRRDLEYTYGAFVLSPRLARPDRLIFEIEDAADGACRLTVRLDSHVRPWFLSSWKLGVGAFWRFFRRTIDRGVTSRERRNQGAVVLRPVL